MEMRLSYLFAKVALDHADHCADEAKEDAAGEKRLNEAFENGIGGEKVFENSLRLCDVEFGLVLTRIPRGHHLRGHFLANGPFIYSVCPIV